MEMQMGVSVQVQAGHGRQVFVGQEARVAGHSRHTEHRQAGGYATRRKHGGWGWWTQGADPGGGVRQGLGVVW